MTGVAEWTAAQELAAQSIKNQCTPLLPSLLRSPPNIANTAPPGPLAGVRHVLRAVVRP